MALSPEWARLKAVYCLSGRNQHRLSAVAPPLWKVCVPLAASRGSAVFAIIGCRHPSAMALSFQPPADEFVQIGSKGQLVQNRSYPREAAIRLCRSYQEYRI